MKKLIVLLMILLINVGCSSNSTGSINSIVTNDFSNGDSYITISKGQYIKVIGAHLEK